MLRKLEVTSNRDNKGKMTPKWGGLFKVTRVVKTNTYHL